MSITKERKSELISTFGKTAEDSGSSAVQVAILTDKIQYLTEHMKIHKKDFDSRRGLLKMVGQRRHLLDYIRKCDDGAYKKLIADLGLRR